MDRHALALFIPILALTIPVVAIVIAGLTKMARYKAMGDGGGAAQDRLDMLEQEVIALRQELAEVHERVDFTERLLSQPRPEAREGIRER
jgi:hypothetical protein